MWTLRLSRQNIRNCRKINFFGRNISVAIKKAKKIEQKHDFLKNLEAERLSTINRLSTFKNFFSTIDYRLSEIFQRNAAKKARKILEIGKFRSKNTKIPRKWKYLGAARQDRPGSRQRWPGILVPGAAVLARVGRPGALAARKK